MDSKPFVIGIICNGNNNEDILFYKKEFKLINRLFKDKVKLIFIGHDPESNILDGIDYSYTRPVSIIHWGKHIKSIKVDLMFVPLLPNTYNESSENLSKFLETSIYGIPIISLNQYPYNVLINDDFNGFVYDSRETFIDHIKQLFSKKLHRIQICGMNALETHMRYLSYSEENIESLLSAFD